MSEDSGIDQKKEERVEQQRHPLFGLPVGCPEFIVSLKQRIRTTQVNTAPLVNRELVLIYWQIGNDSLTRQEQRRLGSKDHRPLILGPGA